MEVQIYNEKIIVKLEKKLSNDNADSIYNKIKEVLNKNKILILDLKNLSDITPLGLRKILEISKQFTKLIIINADKVYNKFEMSGFTQIIDIRKEIPKISIENCEIIGVGSFSKVYKLNEDTIVKVINNKKSEEDIYFEYYKAKKAFIFGIPSPIPLNVVKINDNFGIVFEMINCTLKDYICEHLDELDDIIDKYVQLLKKVNSVNASYFNIPDAKTVMINHLEEIKNLLTNNEYKNLLKLISSIPDSNSLIHGDLHIKNIMYNKGELLLIDMDLMSKGNPIFEFCNLAFGYICFREPNPNETTRYYGLNNDIIDKIYYDSVKKYYNIDDDERLNNLLNKIFVLAFTLLIWYTITYNNNFTERIDGAYKQLKKYINLINI